LERGEVRKLFDADRIERKIHTEWLERAVRSTRRILSVTLVEPGPLTKCSEAKHSAWQHQRIITVPFDTVHGDLLNLQAGDHVDVYAIFSLVTVNKDGSPANGGVAHTVLRMIMSNVPVESLKGGNINFKVSDVQATKLAFASDSGKLWLALRPAAGAETAKPSLVTVETLMLGVKPQLVYSSLGGH